jgi:tRNA 2-selenouridine synthase
VPFHINKRHKACIDLAPLLNFYLHICTVVAITKIEIEEFIELAKTLPVLDVRSPDEFAHAHIPGAFSFPIFSNDERKIIGTAYKQESRETAIKIGLEAFGKNMVKMVEEAEKISSSTKTTSREIGVHCWRGGMRSAAMAWLLDLYGFKVYLLVGGYKTYRSWALKQFETKRPFYIVGGYTGGNKTGIIQHLQKVKEPAIDLEKLAGHKGSAFGNLEGIEQPSQEHFENVLALQLHHLQKTYPDKAVWLEGESQRIGNINIPLPFFENMRRQQYFFMDIPFEPRLQHIIEGYGKQHKDALISAILRIKKKLGGLEMKNAVNALLEDDVRGCFTILLKYYDKLYLKSTTKENEDAGRVIPINTETTDEKINTEKLLEHVRNRIG